MSGPTRSELEGLKRPALQQRCKELGIKANGKTELLIELVLSHYESEGEKAGSGTSKATASKKRKADATTQDVQATAEHVVDEDEDEQNVHDANAAGTSTIVPQRLPSTRRRAAAPPPSKARRVVSRTRTKVEPEDDLPLTHPTLASPRHAQILEVVMNTPLAKLNKGKVKAKEAKLKQGDLSGEQRAEGASDGTEALPGPSTRLPGTRPLEAERTSATVLDTTAETPIQPQIDAHETRIADLELQIRNARKSSDEAAREVLALKGFQHAIQQSFGDAHSLDTLDSMSQLAKIRDVAPKLIALSNLDPRTINTRIESIEKNLTDLEATVKKEQRAITELKDRVRELEEGKDAIKELEAQIRQLQSQFNRIPDSVFERPQDPAMDPRYTIIRAPSQDSTAQQRASSRISVPPEDNIPPPPVQDQNEGRATSVVRSVRGSRPPLAEKESASTRAGQSDVEAETTDSRRSARRLAESVPPSSGNSGPSSRARSTTPSQREPSVAPASGRGKGKGRVLKTTGTALDTVDEDAGASEEQPNVPNPFTPTAELPRSPPAALNLANRDSSPSPPPSISKPSSRAASTLGDGAPIAGLPFKLTASPTKLSRPSTSQSPAPAGRVGKTSHRHGSPEHPGDARITASESVSDAPEVPQTQTFNFALPPAPSTSTTGGNSGTTNNYLKNHPGFITPERLSANFNIFPAPKFDFGKTPGGLAFKTTGRAAPGTPAVTTTLFGTEVARDNRFADLAYDPDTSTGSLSWDESTPIWPSGAPYHANK